MSQKKASRGDFLGGAYAPPRKTSSPKSEEPKSGSKAGGRQDFFERVWQVVAEIPRGKVTTYGHIAGYLGSKSAARTVGWALKAAADSGLPCHRVVNRFGALSGQRSFGGPHIMEDLLRSEGVHFVRDSSKGRDIVAGSVNGEPAEADVLMVVDMENHLWTPE